MCYNEKNERPGKLRKSADELLGNKAEAQKIRGVKREAKSLQSDLSVCKVFVF